MSKFNAAAMLAALILPAGAQNAPPGPASPQSAPAIHTTVNEVVLDLVVRDKKARRDKILAPAAVEIYEPGVRHHIKSLKLVSARFLTGRPFLSRTTKSKTTS